MRKDKVCKYSYNIIPHLLSRYRHLHVTNIYLTYLPAIFFESKKYFLPKDMLPFLTFILFILAKYHTHGSYSYDCMNVVITDCDRNFCESQTEPDWPSAELCQLTCQLSGDSCQSWAYSSNNLVIT